MIFVLVVIFSHAAMIKPLDKQHIRKTDTEDQLWHLNSLAALSTDLFINIMTRLAKSC